MYIFQRTETDAILVYQMSDDQVINYLTHCLKLMSNIVTCILDLLLGLESDLNHTLKFTMCVTLCRFLSSSFLFSG